MKFEYQAAIAAVAAVLGIIVSVLIYRKISGDSEANKSNEATVGKNTEVENPQVLPQRKQEEIKEKAVEKVKGSSGNEVASLGRPVNNGDQGNSQPENPMNQGDQAQTLSSNNVNTSNKNQPAINETINIGQTTTPTVPEVVVIESNPDLAEILVQNVKPDHPLTPEEYGAYLQQEKDAIQAFEFLKREDLSKEDQEKCKRLIAQRLPEFVHFVVKNSSSLDSNQKDFF